MSRMKKPPAGTGGKRERVARQVTRTLNYVKLYHKELQKYSHVHPGLVHATLNKVLNS